MKRVVFAIALVGCTAGPGLLQYPRRSIDRPYTIPPGVASWSVDAKLTAARDNTYPTAFRVAARASWALALSQDWELILGPPIGVSRQLVHDSRHRLGASLILDGFGFGSEGVYLAPRLSAGDDLRISRNWSWGIGASAEVSRWTGGPPWNWYFGVGTGPLWQATDELAIRPGVVLWYSSNDLSVPTYPAVRARRLTTNASLEAIWSIGRQWDLNAGIGYGVATNADGYREFRYSLGVANFW